VGLGQFFTRDLKITQTDTVSGVSVTDVIVQPPYGMGWPEWHAAGPYQGCLQISAAWRASLLLAELLGRLPWDEYRSISPEPEDPPEKQPVPPILEQPAPPDTRMVTFSSMGLDALFHGNAVAIITSRDRQGYPSSFAPVVAERVWIKRVQRGDALPWPVGSIAYWIGPQPVPDADPRDGSGRWYRPDEIFHVKGMCRPGALRGMGVLEVGLNGGPLALAQTLSGQAANVSEAGVPTMHIRSFDPDFDSGQAAELKSKAIETQRVRSPMVTNALVEAKPLAWNPTETQLLEARKFSLVEIANMFGMDAEWLNAGQVSGTYQNIEQKGIDFLRHSAGGWLARFEQALTAIRPRGRWVEANRNAELQSDTLTRFQCYEIAIRNGFMTRDEVRALERRKPLTEEQKIEALPTEVTSHEPAGPPGGAGAATGVPGGPPRGARQPGRTGMQGPSHGAGQRPKAAKPTPVRS